MLKVYKLCLRNNLRDYWKKSHKENQMYNQEYNKMKITLEI